MVWLILDKIDFKTKTLRDKGECFIMVKVSIHQQDIIVINVFVPKNRAPKTHGAKTFKLNGKTDNSTTIFGALTFKSG